jgi:hypothetical protein
MNGKNGIENNFFRVAINQGVSPEIASLIGTARKAESEGHTETSFFFSHLKINRFHSDWKRRFSTAREEALEIGIWPWN